VVTGGGIPGASVNLPNNYDGAGYLGSEGIFLEEPGYYGFDPEYMSVGPYVFGPFWPWQQLIPDAGAAASVSIDFYIIHSGGSESSWVDLGDPGGGNVPGVPEPTTTTLLATALLVLAGAIYLRRCKVRKAVILRNSPDSLGIPPGV
jgi:hypothetical protein